MADKIIDWKVVKRKNGKSSHTATYWVDNLTCQTEEVIMTICGALTCEKCEIIAAQWFKY